MIAPATKSMSFVRRLEDACLVVVAPKDCVPAGGFANACPDGLFRETILDEIQCLRGRVYLEDGAIAARCLDAQGRFRSELDERSWHLALLNEHMQVAGCIRLTQYQRLRSCRDLKVHELIERMPGPDAAAYRHALQSYVDQTVQEGQAFYEIGGWAVAAQHRNSTKGIILACACWSLAQLLAPGRGVASATLRNQSAPLLRRLGAFSLHHRLKKLTKFFDPVYDCDMELLAFDTAPARDLHRTVAVVHDYLKRALVVTNLPTVAGCPC
jgi:hypothetical protein